MLNFLLFSLSDMKLRIQLAVNLLYLSFLCTATEAVKLTPYFVEQSSTYRDAYARNAVDGNITSISHTGNDKPSWFRLHFKKSICPSKIIVINGKSNSAAIWLDNSEVYILASNNSK